MAGAGYKLFNTGDVLTAAQVNTYLMEQSIMVFANAAARTTALSGVLAEGMISYLKDTDAVEKYNGTSWIAMQPGDIEGVTASSPLTGGGTSGTVTIGIQDASTSQKGAVQLSDSITTTSSTLAATSTAVKAAAETSNNLTMVQQYTATESVLKNISSRVSAGEQLLKQAVYWIDAAQSDNSDQVLDNQGWGAPALTTQLGSTTGADSNDPKFLDFTGINYVYLPGVTGNTLSVPDSAALDITGDIDIRAYVANDSWTQAETMYASKWGNAGNRSYAFYSYSDGKLYFNWSADGTNAISKGSTAATGLSAGTAKWIRVTLDVDNGASGNDVKFFTSDDGITWTQLGSTVTTAGTTSIYASTADLSIGSYPGVSNMPFKVFRTQILNGIDGNKILDVDTSSIGSGSATSFSALTGQTVTINRSSSGKKSVVVTHPVWLFGTDDYMEVADNDYIDFGSSENFTVITVNRIFGTNSNFATLIGKFNSATNDPGYNITSLNASANVAFNAPDGTTGHSTGYAQPYTSGNLAIYAGSRSGTTLSISLNGATATTATGSSATLANALPLRIGRASSGTLYMDAEFIAAAIFRRVLTAGEITTIVNYYNARIGA